MCPASANRADGHFLMRNENTIRLRTYPVAQTGSADRIPFYFLFSTGRTDDIGPAADITAFRAYILGHIEKIYIQLFSHIVILLHI